MNTLPSPECVVKVGEGRGFICEFRVSTQGVPHNVSLPLPKFLQYRVIVTSAHCLPNLPPAHPGAYTEERTFKNLVATLDGNKKDIWTECLFADPVADIAVLGPPDNQKFVEEPEDYDTWIENTPILSIGNARSGTGYMLSLDGKWKPTDLKVDHTIRGVFLSSGPTTPGQSGSPILNAAGRAVAVVSLGSEITGANGKRENVKAGPQPILRQNLPVWMLR